MSQGYQSRAASEDDLPALCELEAVIFGRDAWSQQSLMSELAPGEGDGDYARYSVVSCSAGHVVGYAFARTGGEDAEILRVVVAPAHRRKGLATALLTAALAAARRQRCVRALLEVDADDAAAVGCYSALGFTPLHRRVGYYASGGDALVMALVLTPPVHVGGGEAR